MITKSIKLLAIVLLLVIFFTGVMILKEVCVFSEVKAQIYLNGLPVSNALVKRVYEYRTTKTEESYTDSDGNVYFQGAYIKSFASIFPIEFVVPQAIFVYFQNQEYKIWSNTKRATKENSELGGIPLVLSCDLKDPVKLYKEFGSILQTNCIFGDNSKQSASRYYRFSHNLTSIDWLSQIPSSILGDLVDLDYSIVTINTEAKETRIYVGPKEPDAGGSAVSIILDENLNFIRYEIEHLAPVPFLK